MPKNTHGVPAFPPDATVGGHSMEFWTGEWWTTLLQSPVDDNMRLTGSEDVGPVTMLMGLESPGGTITRSFHVESGDALLVPVLNFFDVEGPRIPGSPNGHAAQAGLRDAILDAWFESIDLSHSFLEVDGQRLGDLGAYFHRTDVFSMGRVKDGSIIESLGVKQGVKLDGTEAEGIMVMLHPLTPGEHRISFGGSVDAFVVDGTPYGVDDLQFPAFDYKVTDHIIVA